MQTLRGRDSAEHVSRQAHRDGLPSRLCMLATYSTLCMVATLASTAAHAADLTFRIEFSPEVHDRLYTGRVYVFFSRHQLEPRWGPDWFSPEPFIAADVENWAPDTPLVLSSSDAERVLAFPKRFGEISLDGYRAQAVVRFNPWERNVGIGSGNGYSRVRQVDDGSEDASPLSLVVDKLVPERRFVENRWCKLFEVRSNRLSEFHERDVALRAAVILPASYYDNPDLRYPTILIIPGFGGTHFDGHRTRPVPENNRQGVQFLRVFLDPSCPLGHHVFADSANNGPVGTAFVTEFLPAYEQSFRAVADSRARFLTGHSSGGWSSLWLQVRHPDQFGGTWSTAPDPVDFRDFQRIDLYRPGENMYVDSNGRVRPLARRGEQVLIWYREFAHMEHVLGYGGQLHSFEAVFSPRGRNGSSLLLWNRKTGAVDTDVANTWQAYDIRLVLERNWPELGPKLQGKLHVFMGGLDTFYLEGATILLKESLEKLGSDAVVEIHEGKGHGSLMTADLRQRIRGEMVETFLQTFPNYATQSARDGSR